MSLEQEIRQTTFRSEFHKALLNLIYTHNVLINSSAGFFKSYGITRQQYNVLRILRGQPGGVTIQMIRERMLDKMSDASRIVERLRAKRLASRQLNTEDRRTVKITITDEGNALLDAMESRIGDLERGLRNLTEEEAHLLNSLLDRIRQNIG
ncbi:MAG: MarR family transcriptional regulator [Bacteroidota bacterium]|jgi:DNA-binding MarR family transcriptional regulator|nr:MAG: MarR family transcriptional regulator [Bacteroidota bacterium]